MTKRELDEIINQWIGGNDDVYREIFNYYYPRLLSACLKSVKRYEDGEEIVMNIWLHIWLQRDKMQEVQDFERYIYSMLRNQVASFFRRNILVTEDIENIALDLLGTDQSDLTFKELQQLYVNAVNKLPEKQRRVFVMSREEGLNHKQIASENNISVNTVNNHIKSAMKVLRNDLGEYADLLALLIMLVPLMV